jgi:hypothetical protein
VDHPYARAGQHRPPASPLVVERLRAFHRSALACVHVSAAVNIDMSRPRHAMLVDAHVPQLASESLKRDIPLIRRNRDLREKSPVAHIIAHCFH